ncbi:BT_3044 domain-containing protein [Parabacteroides pacaensis]|uniref:BT_3044 domain-containing protein n=1 Tax=Parabacteroides pacaensis TaxID=2086575 RepID=UPI000D0E6B67|nr:DUF4361 domain-containing protein [Parabacteroides pacaensis]
MKLTNILLASIGVPALLVSLSACEKEFYQDEQYRKEIYFVSEDENVSGQEFEFGGTVNFLSLYFGGSAPVNQDVSVRVSYDLSYLQAYNKRMYDTSYDKYGLELPAENYKIEDWSRTLKANSETPYVLFPIQVDVTGLSPDRDYFIPLKIDSVSNYMISKTKNYVLFQIFLKNEYATTKKDTYYNMTGTSLQGTEDWGFKPGNQDPVAIISTKLVVPLAKNSVRILPSNKFSMAQDQIRHWGINVTVHPDETIDVPAMEEGVPTGETISMYKVTLSPYIDSGLSVKLLDVEGKPSTYDPESKTFYLNYCYSIGEKNSENKDVWYEMTETMIRPAEE